MSISFRTKLDPKLLGYPVEYPEVFELRWDLFGCILGCEFCSSPAQPEMVREAGLKLSPAEVFSETKKNLSHPSRSYVRFSGGEPTIYWKELLEVLALFAEDETLVAVPVVIKTNGISVGNGTVSVHQLTRSPFNRLKILFELSIKGTNSKEFEILTRTSSKLYSYQLNAYKMLKNVQHHNPNLSYVCVLSVYHSSEEPNRSKFVFIYPQDETPMFDQHKPWNKQFETMWKETKTKWTQPLTMNSQNKWDSFLNRCGTKGAGIIKHYPQGTPTNTKTNFQMRPNNYQYVKAITNHQYW